MFVEILETDENYVWVASKDIKAVHMWPAQDSDETGYRIAFEFYGEHILTSEIYDTRLELEDRKAHLRKVLGVISFEELRES